MWRATLGVSRIPQYRSGPEDRLQISSRFSSCPRRRTQPTSGALGGWRTTSARRRGARRVRAQTEDGAICRLFRSVLPHACSWHSKTIQFHSSEQKRFFGCRSLRDGRPVRSFGGSHDVPPRCLPQGTWQTLEDRSLGGKRVHEEIGLASRLSR